MGVTIIAEAGVNHNGDILLAKKLVDAAVESRADVVKFQLFNPALLVSKSASMADYQIENTKTQETQFEMLRKLTLSFEMQKKIAGYCRDRGIAFNSSPFDLESIEVLKKIDVDFWKIPSGEITNLPYLISIANSGKPVVLSSGMSDIEELKDALDVLRNNGAGKVTVLHCNTEYPTPYEDVNLNAMLTIKRELGVPVGLSDHTAGISVPVAAVALGAEVIEKHLTLDRNMDGPDHKASLEPYEFKTMVEMVRDVEAAMGTGMKKPSPSERKNIVIARKSIIAATNIFKGDIFTENNIAIKRPGNGVSPMKWFDVLGTRAKRNFMADELIEL